MFSFRLEAGPVISRSKSLMAFAVFWQLALPPWSASNCREAPPSPAPSTVSHPTTPWSGRHVPSKYVSPLASDLQFTPNGTPKYTTLSPAGTEYSFGVYADVPVVVCDVVSVVVIVVVAVVVM